MNIARIWANRLEAGTKKWSEVPETRKDDVKTILHSDVETGHNGMTAERYETITGEKYA